MRAGGVREVCGLRGSHVAVVVKTGGAPPILVDFSGD